MKILFLAKYLDTATVKTIANVYNTAFPSDIIYTKANSFNSDNQI